MDKETLAPTTAGAGIKGFLPCRRRRRSWREKVGPFNSSSTALKTENKDGADHGPGGLKKAEKAINNVRNELLYIFL